MEKPILFNTEMVRAILAGRKTQTRRPVKPQPVKTYPLGFIVDSTSPAQVGNFAWGTNENGGVWDMAKPPYREGDVLWVRETWADTWTPDGQMGFVYKADGKPAYFPYWGNESLSKDEVWRPSVHMPREAARLFLRVASVRVERVQDISEADAIVEGVEPYRGGYKLDLGEKTIMCPIARVCFQVLWDSIYIEPKPVYEDGEIVSYVSYPWEDVQETRTHKGKPWVVCGNPWLWIVEFEVIKP